MKMRPLALFILATILFRCSNGYETDHSQKKQQDLPVTYSLAGKPSLKWTAYKFTSRVAVSGSFDDIRYETNQTSGKLSDIITGTSFKINPHSVNSNLKFRDDRILTYFFEENGVDQISGKFTRYDRGKGSIELTLGGVTHDVDFDTQLHQNLISINTEINLQDWNGGPGLEALNEICRELHTGPDGISKLWPDVIINVSIPINPGNIALCD